MGRRLLHVLLPAVLWLAVAPASADYLDGATSWPKPWKRLEFGDFAVGVNFAGDMSVTAGGVGFGFGQVSGSWHGKNFSTHNNLSGTGPWSEVKGSEEKQGEATLLTVEGVMTDMRVKETLLVVSNSLVFRWRGEIVDPTPELARVYGHSGALATWQDPNLNPSFEARLTYGEAVEARFRDDFGELPNVRSFSFGSGGTTVRVDFVKARSVSFRRADEHPRIPVRYSLVPMGANPSHLMPGSVLEYEIKVTVRAAANKAEKKQKERERQ